MTVDLRLGLPGIAAWVAAAIVIGVPVAALPVAVGLWLVAALLLVFRPRWTTIAALAVAAAALCCTSIAIETPARQPASMIDAATAHRHVDLVATTTATVLPGSGSFPVAVGAVPMLVFGEHPDERVGIGATLTISGTLTAAEPGDDESFLLFSEGAPTVIAAPAWYLEWANGLRSGFLAATARLPGDGGDLLAGLAIGDTSAVSDELDAAMKSSSLSHLTAVSGANCAVVIALVMAAGGALGLSRGLRVGASAAVLVGFVVLVTPEPSVLRAALMAALVLLALSRGRPVRGIPVLAVASIALLVNDPWLARSYGFALSVLATGGLLLLASPLARVLERWMPRWLALTIAVPLAAQLACQPLIITLNASLPTYGVLANVLAEPAAPVATVLGLAGCVAVALLPPLGSLLTAVAWLPSAWIAGVARFFAALPGAQLPWPEGVGGVALLAAVTGLAIAAILGRGRVAVFGLALCVVAYVALAGGSRAAVLAGRPADWQIAGCDVGQGDSFLVRSEGQVALIDTGPDPKLLSKCLDELGISRVDLLVLTHYDLDHVGGVEAVVGRAASVFIGPSDGPKADRIVADLVAGGSDVQQVSRGPSGLLGDLRWSILWPPRRLGDIEPGNAASVTIEFDPVGECPKGCLSSMFLGDLGEDAQRRLLAANPLGPVDVVKVSHHGSADQYEPLYQRLDATLGLIGVGKDNGYGHPTEALLDILARAGTEAVRTDQHGMILLEPGDEPGTVSVWTER